MVNIAINGFGRIGRLVLRIGFDNPNLNFVVINDLTDAKTLGHLLKYDSLHGIWAHDVEAEEGCIKVDGNEIKVISEKNPKNYPWKKFEVDVVVESTGIFRTKEALKAHINAGAKKALLSAPPKEGEVKTIVFGANENEIHDVDIASNASCTTNSLVPIAQVLDKEFGIESGFMSTIHAYTNDQRLLDLPHKDLRRGRAAPVNIIPTSTGAAKAVGKVLPQLDGKLDGVSFRVPVPCGSITDFVCLVRKETTAEQVNKAIKKAAENELKHVLEYSELPLVSSDIIGNKHSSIFDSQMTKVNGKLIKISTWYDNEYGFSCRMVDMLELMSKN